MVMMKIEKLLQEVSEDISLKPKELSELKGKVRVIVKKIQKKLKREKITLGGSLAKNTLIRRRDQDVDLFIVFDEECETKKLGSLLRKTGLKVSAIHGSREYFQLIDKEIKFEFIPIVKVSKDFQNKNTSDFSPLHVKYVSEKIKLNPLLAKEIRLAKQFCIAQEVYGAESYINGFSGYALELLTIHYRNFIRLLKKIQKEGFIDVEKKFKNKREAFRELNSAKLTSPLVLIDPTYKYRNVCAGLSLESFERFKIAAREFLKKPSKEFFETKDFNLDEFLNGCNHESVNVYQFIMKTSRDNQDIAATKMKKFFNFIVEELNKKQQEVIGKKFLVEGKNLAKAYLIIKPKENI
jgi:tRNA nucleotidyltransferase (CCA-adding enzyme)